MLMVCGDCRIEMRNNKTGVFIEMMTTEGPYKVFSTDLYACPNCKKSAYINPRPVAVAEHFQETYEHKVSMFRPVLKFWANMVEKSQYRGILP
jgi:hypothetical protein